MTGTLLRISFINLRRDRVVQALTFLLPILFFSIFALVFGNQKDSTHKVRVALVDEDQSAYSTKVARALAAEGGLAVQTTARPDGSGGALTRQSAEALVKNGTVPVAVVLPKGLGAGSRLWGDRDASTPKVQLLADVSDPVAPQMVQGLLQKVSFTAAPEALASEGIQMFEKYSGPLTPQQQQSKDLWLKEIGRDDQTRAAGGTRTTGPDIGLATEIVNVMQPGAGSAATISFYAAGVGVMFLLFSCSGAGGSLLEEEEAGTLGRLLSSRAGMAGVLGGKWLFVLLMGVAQLSVMFLWGALVFHLPLWTHVPGFLIMTVFTAAAAAAFGLLLATISRSRQQLAGLSTIVILTMSAVGGSMFPRFLMSETMQKIGLVTFNAWALDGYLKVFWREAPISDLWPQVAVLMTLTMVFLAGARIFARRWETL
jgi:ABC-2 type transport system permease protein